MQGQNVKLKAAREGARPTLMRFAVLWAGSPDPAFGEAIHKSVNLALSLRPWREDLFSLVSDSDYEYDCDYD